LKLLFDENLSFRLPRVLTELFPESLHVEDVGLETSEDETISALRDGAQLRERHQGRGLR